jgi:hypothetical protein
MQKIKSFKKLKVDWDHIFSGHMAGGSRTSPIKSLFPKGWTKLDVEKAIKEGYKNAKRVYTQTDINGIVRVKLIGEFNGVKIEYWLNITENILESAYPVK